MVRDQTGRFSVSRRTLLGSVGLTCLSAVSGSSVVAAAESDYDTVVNIEAEGADSSGQNPIDDIFADVKGDDTLVKFPEGTYKANKLIVYGLTNFAMVGEGDVTLVPGDDYDPDLWIAGSETRDVRIENFTFDHRGDGVAPQVDLGVHDGLVLRDVTKIGVHDDGGPATSIRVYEGGSALVERYVATDGGEAVGLYAGGEGSMTVRDSRIEQFEDNGLYVSHIAGRVVVEGGTFRNNNVSQVRVGSPNSVVRNATIEVEESLSISGETARNMRGIRVADGPGPVTIEGCDIAMTDGEGSGGIVGAYSGGSFDVLDTRIYIGESYTTIGSDGSRGSYGIFVDNATDAPTGTRTFDGVSITGSGSYRSAIELRRDDTTVRNCCIEQSGSGRDGIVVRDSTDTVVTDSTIDVPDKTVNEDDSNVSTSNVDTSGSCPLPSTDGGGNDRSDDQTNAVGETGTVETDQTDSSEWHPVSLQNSYEAPITVMNSLSFNGYHPCKTRLRNIESDSFEFQLEEWAYLGNGGHWTETAHYLVLERGEASFGGLPAAADTVTTNHTFTDLRFDQSFETTPVVFVQSQTYVGSDPITARVANVTSDGMSVRLQEEDGEENGGYHYDETVGYVAIEPGTGTFKGQPFEASRTADTVDESWHTIEFEQSYDNPRFIANIQTYDGYDSVICRYRNLTSDSVEVRLQEEQSEDEETRHTSERVGYLVIEG